MFGMVFFWTQCLFLWLLVHMPSTIQAVTTLQQLNQELNPGPFDHKLDTLLLRYQATLWGLNTFFVLPRLRGSSLLLKLSESSWSVY